MLKISGLSAWYGMHKALDDVSLEVHQGEVVSVLGANGAGKSTLLKALAGLIPVSPDAQLHLGDQFLNALRDFERVEAGIALVPEGRGIFGEMTVQENLLMGAYPNRARQQEQENLSRILELFPRLKERLPQAVRTMSGGEQQMVAIGRALMSKPEVLLLDEPSLGLSPLMVSELFKVLERVCQTGVTILMVEQNARRSLKLSHRGYLIEQGRIVGSGSASELLNDETVRKAYLGG